MLSDECMQPKEQMNREELAYSAWFHSVAYIGDVSLFRLLEQFGSMKAAYHAKETQLLQILKPRQYTSFLAAKYKQTPLNYLQTLEQEGIRYVPVTDEIYPERLRHIPDPAFGLFVKGTLPDEKKPSVALIGARACSEYGKQVAREFASYLSKQGVQIISGMARGIDSIGQKACMECGGRTFAVLGNGVDICYPPEMTELYQNMLQHGGVLSSYPPKTAPLARQFPPRNRLISGLADVILVVEARQKSGTLITVDMALEQGKEVAVIPGKITDALSQGCLELIRQGATMITEPQQVLELLHCPYRSEQPKTVRVDIDAALQDILRVLTTQPQDAEILYQTWKAQVPNGTFRSFMEGLVDLELLDLCKSEKNRFYIR